MPNSSRLHRYSLVLALILLPVSGALLIASGFFLYLLPQLPDVNTLKHITFKTPLQIFSKDGQLIAEYGDEHTRPLTYSQIPPLFIKAVTSAEDDRFFSHEGIDPRGLARASWELLTTGSIRTGGSTITMQVAKNFFLSRERTFARKFTEILLAHEIERSLTKQEIITLYVNKIFLGHRAYGIAAAAQVYFGKDISQLSLPQLAMIAGLPKAPSRYNPVDDAPRAIERRNWILGRMHILGYITDKQYQQAIQAPIGLNYRGTISEVQGLYLAEMVRDTLVEHFGQSIYTSGWKVYTTVSANRQNAAHDAVRSGLVAYDHRHGYRGPEGLASQTPLENYHVINGMYPAEIINVSETSARAQLRDGQEITINWNGLKWARKALADGRIGFEPKSAYQIVHRGDIIRCMQVPSGWELAELPQVQGLLVALDPRDGSVQALVGGFDFFSSKFNRITQGGRQVGSSMKPFIFASALNKGYSPASLFDDGPLSFTFGDKVWTPQDDDGEFMGPITLRKALYLSRNLVSIRVLQTVGLNYAINYLGKFGLPARQLPQNLTLALGTADMLPIQMATAYATFANGGYRINPYFIDHIVNAQGKTIYRANPLSACVDSCSPAQWNHHAPRVIAPSVAYMMTSMLKDVILHGTGRGALAVGRSDLAGKTGTTNDAFDAWFDGYNPNLVAITWVGFDEPKGLGPGEFGGVAAVPIWNAFMKEALAGQPEKGWSMPNDVQQVWFNQATGTLTSATDPDAHPDLMRVSPEQSTETPSAASSTTAPTAPTASGGLPSSPISTSSAAPVDGF